MSDYAIFGAGPSGLYTAWRLVKSDKLTAVDTLSLYDWGNYEFEKQMDGSRAATGRICTYHCNNDPNNSYIEVGGMRYLQWDKNEPEGSGHRLVSTVIEELNLNDLRIDFNTTENPLFYLRGQNVYGKEIAKDPVRYATVFNDDNPDKVFNDLATNIFNGASPKTRVEQLQYYQEGMLKGAVNSAYSGGTPVRNVGYWDAMYNDFGEEAYQYADDGGGYTSNVINWNTADAIVYNSEFAPGGKFKTLSTGMSTIFTALFEEIKELCAQKNIVFNYYPNTKLHSIKYDVKNKKTHYKTANKENPKVASETKTADYSFLAMPRESLEIVAEGTSYQAPKENLISILNTGRVPLYIESVIKQPSYKIAMFFDTEWWLDATYPPDLSNNVKEPAFGPTITDLPVRQVYYFGDNGKTESKRYGILGSYDDMQYIYFWREMEKNAGLTREVPMSDDTQPIEGPVAAPTDMVNMLRKQLAKIHFGPDAPMSSIPEPVETVFMDWSLKPFGAGYHAWAPSYDINDVMDKIRKPSQLIEGDIDANMFIVGSAYSNDQAWIEGAFCTAESVLNDFLDVEPIISPEFYPFIGNSSGVLNGPVGGVGGKFFNDANTFHDEIEEISVWFKEEGTNSRIVAIEFDYNIGGKKQYGTPELSVYPPKRIILKGCKIISFEVVYDPKMFGNGRVVGIKIATASRTLFTCGNLNGLHSCVYKAPKEMSITAFCGRSGTDIDALGVVYNMNK